MKMKITRQSHPHVVALLQRTYPDYRGRLFNLNVSEKARIWDFWDGGSRTYQEFVELATGRAASSNTLPDSLRQKQGNWFNLPISEPFVLPPEVGIAEHHIFCGKDRGLTLVVSPAVSPALLGYEALSIKEEN